MGRTNLGARELCDASETTLHSHPGGGNGAVIKAGTISSNAQGNGSVVFGTAFASINYAISLSCEDPGDAPIVYWLNKTVAGFDIKTMDDGGKVESNVTVDWIATPYSNP